MNRQQAHYHPNLNEPCAHDVKSEALRWSDYVIMVCAAIVVVAAMALFLFLLGLLA